LFEKVGNFDPRQGRIGEKLFKGEESDLIRRALEAGLRIAYDSTITVFHRIGPDRTRRAYFRRLAFERGQNQAQVAAIDGRRHLLGAPTAAYRAALLGFGRWARLWLRRRPDSFDQELRWLRSFGELTGFWKSRRGGSTPS
ncbi:MAG TPA: hypothetical protein VFA98_04905, partial [Thermoanaerobaculia bacterium]|nr:hypothetical protein [Thermoanaerobaculia bacterium]